MSTFPKIEIRRNSDDVTRSYVDEYPWQGVFIWQDGNYSCDCNRYLFFERADGKTPEWDDGECGDGGYSVRITAPDGKLLYSDGEWTA